MDGGGDVAFEDIVVVAVGRTFDVEAAGVAVASDADGVLNSAGRTCSV